MCMARHSPLLQVWWVTSDQVLQRSEPKGSGGHSTGEEGGKFSSKRAKKGRGSQLLYKRIQGTQNQFQKGEDGSKKKGVVIETLNHAEVQRGGCQKRGGWEVQG